MLNMKVKYKAILKNLVFYLILVLIVCGEIFSKKFGGLDEIWNYNFARCIHDGLLPYRDISLVIAPLFPMICSVFLKILGNELIVIRLLSCLVFAGTLFIIYKIFIRLKINDSIAFLMLIRNSFVCY